MQPNFLPGRFSTAPMVDLTDRHCLFFWRLLTRRALLYTEMISTDAIINGARDQLLDYGQVAYPVALQLGGNDPDDMAFCALEGQRRGFAEININAGCPSPRVQNGCFGAVLMSQSARVGACIRRMKEKGVTIPGPVKCRTGIDSLDDYEFLRRFVSDVAESGASGVIIHARQAFLKGLSPRENRDKPPMDYQKVYRIKREYPELFVSVNGEIRTLDDALAHLEKADGVMLGRGAYQNPYLLAEVDERIFGEKNAPKPAREEILERMIPYAEDYAKKGGKISNITRHMLDLYASLPGARTFRRTLSQEAVKPGADAAVIRKAMEAMSRARRDAEDQEEIR